MFGHLDHIGIATADLDLSIKLYEDKFGFRLTHREVVAAQRTELAFLKLENTEIELLTPSEESGTIYNFLQKRGPGLHHLCYRVADIKVAMEHLIGLDLKPIDKEPRVGARNHLIAFFHPAQIGGVLTELCQYD